MKPDIQALRLPEELLVVGAAAEMGLFHLLQKGPLFIAQLASQLEVELRPLEILCESLAGLGYLVIDGGQVKLSRAARELFFDRCSDVYVGFSFMYDYEELKLWLQLPEVIKTGKPVRIKRAPEQLRLLMEALAHYASPMVGEVVGCCLRGLPDSPVVLDVGGGTLVYAREFIRQGAAAVVVLDLPAVIKEMAPDIKQEPRIKLVGGDFRQGLPPGHYDLVFIGNICRLYGEEENRALIEHVARRLKKAGRIAILDFIRGTNRRAALFDVNMLIHTARGRTWTFEHFRHWLEDAGFGILDCLPVKERYLIIATVTSLRK